MKTTLAHLTAAAGLTLLVGSSAFAQMAPAPGMTHMVKPHMMKTKSGKMVMVKGHMSMNPTKKTMMMHKGMMMKKPMMKKAM